MEGRERFDRIWCAPFARDRSELLPLFRLADDSEQQIQSYLYDGDVLFAAQGGQVLGHAQVLDQGAGLFELKSIAVVEARQCEGIGGMLVRAALRHCRDRGARTITVSTAICDAQAIGFYLRHGFRAKSIIRDAFTAERGYPAHSAENNLPLNDAVEFELRLGSPQVRTSAKT